MVYNKKIKELQSLLKLPCKITIVMHQNPDGDAIGSSLALFHYLKSRSHDVHVISPSPFAAFLQWLPGSDKVINFQENTKLVKELILKSDLIFLMDLSTLNRIKGIRNILDECAVKRILIDHHPHSGDFADLAFVFPAASSTCELLYEILKKLSKGDFLTAEMAQCLYTGILTDTGSFRFNTTTARTHEVTAELILAGAENHKIFGHIYETFTENKLRLLGYCISSKLDVFEETQTAVIALKKSDLAEYDYEEGDTEGVVNYPLSMEKIKLSVLIMDMGNLIKMSFRSKGDFSINDFAQKYFNGGGHKNAAGGHSYQSLEKTKTKLIDLLPTLVKAEASTNN